MGVEELVVRGDRAPQGQGCLWNRMLLSGRSWWSNSLSWMRWWLANQRGVLTRGQPQTSTGVHPVEQPVHLGHTREHGVDRVGVEVLTQAVPGASLLR